MMLPRFRIEVEGTRREWAEWLLGVIAIVVIPTILIVGGLWLVLR